MSGWKKGAKFALPLSVTQREFFPFRSITVIASAEGTTRPSFKKARYSAFSSSVSGNDDRRTILVPSRE